MKSSFQRALFHSLESEIAIQEPMNPARQKIIQEYKQQSMGSWRDKHDFLDECDNIRKLLLTEYNEHQLCIVISQNVQQHMPRDMNVEFYIMIDIENLRTCMLMLAKAHREVSKSLSMMNRIRIILRRLRQAS